MVLRDKPVLSNMDKASYSRKQHHWIQSTDPFVILRSSAVAFPIHQLSCLDVSHSVVSLGTTEFYDDVT